MALAALGAAAQIPDTTGAPPPGCADAACHGYLLERAVLHAPAEAGDCETCHIAGETAHPEDGGGFTLVEKGTALCGICHEIPAQVDTASTPHPPAMDDCLGCHDAHGAEQPHLLPAAVNELCYQCHDAAAFKVHVVRGVTLGTGHPLAGAQDPAREGESFSCASCHDPHGTSTPHLWRFHAQSSFDLCVRCHKY